jgi:uncharacterized protein YjbI with pentapeptide repeats
MTNVLIRKYIRSLLAEMSTRYRRETGQNLPRWQERLKHYEDMGDCFIHFSFFDKFGLNPQNRFNTPTGFYAYPLNTRYIESFGAERPYMIVFKIKDLSSMLILDDYTSSDLERDLDQMAKMYPDQYSMIIDAKNSTEHPGSVLWETINDVIANKQRNNELIKTRGQNPAFLDEKNPKGPVQISRRDAVYSYMSNFSSKVEALNNAKSLTKIPSELIKPLAGPKVWRAYTKSADERKDLTKFFDFFKSRLIQMVNALPWGEDDIGEQKRSSEYVVNQISSEKTKIIRDLGYAGVIDGFGGPGLGIIHPNEPTQAVFFDLSALEHLETIEKTPGQDSMDPEMFTKVPGSGKDFSSEDFSRKTIKKERNISSNFQNANFTRSKLEESIFDRSNIQGANFAYAVFLMNSFKNVNFEGSDFNNTNFRPGNNLDGSNFKSCIFVGSQFADTKMSSASFENANLSYTEHKYSSFLRSNFAGANFEGSHFKDCIFTESNLNGANFADATFEFCDFRKVKFESVQNLDKATFRGCNIPQEYYVKSMGAQGDIIDLSVKPEDRPKRKPPLELQNLN